MYIPKIRKAAEIVAYFKERDKNTVVTSNFLYHLGRGGKIKLIQIGRIIFFNLDEVISVLSGDKPL